MKRTLQLDDAATDRIVGIYREGRSKVSNLDLAMILASDAWLAPPVCPHHRGTQGQANKAPAYQYYFEWYSPLRDGKIRCMHGMELPFVFDHVDRVEWMTGNGQDRHALANKVSRAWIAFARTGNPNHSGLPTWRPFEPGPRATMVFDTDCQALDDPHREERLAVEAVLDSRPRAPV